MREKLEKFKLPRYSDEKYILIFCIISFIYYALNKITYFDVYGDATLWHHLAKVQAFKMFILDGDMAPPLPYWINGFFLRIYDYQLLPRFVAVSSFVATLIVTRNLLKRLNLEEGKISLFLAVMLLNPFLIYYSRIMYTDIFFFIFLWFTLLNLYIFLENKEKKHLYYSGLSFTLLSLTKGFAIIVFLPVVGVMSLLAIRKKITLRELSEFTAIALIGFIYLGIVNIYGYLHTGLLSQFATRILMMTNFIGFTDVNLQRSNLYQLQNLESASTITQRAIHIISFTLLYTLPFIAISATEKIRRPEMRLFSYSQKVILSILLIILAGLPLVKEFELRHFMVVFPVVFLFVIQNNEIKKLKYAAIVLIAFTSMVNIYSFHLFKENPLLPDSNLHKRSDIRLRTFEYINSHTSRHGDIVIVQGWSGEQNAYETNLFVGSLYEPPVRSKYIVYTPELSPDPEERDNIEKLLNFKDIYTLEKVFTDEFGREYYVYSINPAFCSSEGINFYLDVRSKLHPFGRELEDNPDPTMWEMYEETGVNSPHNTIIGINPFGMYPLEESLISAD